MSVDGDLTPGDILLLVEKLADLGTWRFDVDEFSGVMSPQALKLLGLPKSHGPRVGADEWDAIYGHEQVERARAAIHEAVENGTVYRMELPAQADDGSVKWMMSVGKAFARPQGPELIGFNIDITRTKQAELQRDRERERFERCARAAAINTTTSAVIHEIMQPLAAASIWMESLRVTARSEQLPAHVNAIIDEASRSLQSVARTAKSTHRFLSEGSGEPSSTDIVSILRDVVEEAQARLTYDLHVRFDCRTHAPPVTVDRALIKQLFANVMSNALDASDKNGVAHVEIIYRSRRGRHLVCIRDYGSGLTAAPADALAAPFATASPNGLGIGLWLCNAIARLHGGSIRLSAARPGTLVAIRLQALTTAPHVALAS